MEEIELIKKNTAFLQKPGICASLYYPAPNTTITFNLTPVCSSVYKRQTVSFFRLTDYKFFNFASFK